MIFSPSIGLHENVMVLDYENEYANLIINNNLSPETINASSSHVSSEEQGLLPTVLENVLKRRMYFKKLQQSFPVNRGVTSIIDKNGMFVANLVIESQYTHISIIGSLYLPAFRIIDLEQYNYNRSRIYTRFFNAVCPLSKLEGMVWYQHQSSYQYKNGL